MTPTFQGEVLMRRWSDSSTQGVQVTFALPDAGELEPLKAKTGKRFMAVLVEIGDDEKPVEQPKQREHLGDLCYRAVQWCNDPEFQRWLVGARKLPIANAADAAQVIREVCGVGTRKHLDIIPAAGDIFRKEFVGPYRKHLQARGLV